jgi:hypothetical protein
MGNFSPGDKVRIPHVYDVTCVVVERFTPLFETNETWYHVKGPGGIIGVPESKMELDLVEGKRENNVRVDIDKAQAMMEFMAHWTVRPEISRRVVEALAENQNTLYAMVLTGVEEGIIPNASLSTTRFRDKLIMAFQIGLHHCWKDMGGSRCRLT